MVPQVADADALTMTRCSDQRKRYAKGDRVLRLIPGFALLVPTKLTGALALWAVVKRPDLSSGPFSLPST
jgi:hypothetical protein